MPPPTLKLVGGQCGAAGVLVQYQKVNLPASPDKSFSGAEQKWEEKSCFSTLDAGALYCSTAGLQMDFFTKLRLQIVFFLSHKSCIKSFRMKFYSKFGLQVKFPPNFYYKWNFTEW